MEKITLTVHMSVTYKLNGTSPEKLADVLRGILNGAEDRGELTGSTTAEVLSMSGGIDVDQEAHVAQPSRLSYKEVEAYQLHLLEQSGERYRQWQFEHPLTSSMILGCMFGHDWVPFPPGEIPGKSCRRCGKPNTDYSAIRKMRPPTSHEQSRSSSR